MHKYVVLTEWACSISCHAGLYALTGYLPSSNLHQEIQDARSFVVCIVPFCGLRICNLHSCNLPCGMSPLFGQSQFQLMCKLEQNCTRCIEHRLGTKLCFVHWVEWVAFMNEFLWLCWFVEEIEDTQLCFGSHCRLSNRLSSSDSSIASGFPEEFEGTQLSLSNRLSSSESSIASGFAPATCKQINTEDYSRTTEHAYSVPKTASCSFWNVGWFVGTAETLT